MNDNNWHLVVFFPQKNQVRKKKNLKKYLRTRLYIACFRTHRNQRKKEQASRKERLLRRQMRAAVAVVDSVAAAVADARTSALPSRASLLRRPSCPLGGGMPFPRVEERFRRSGA